MDLILTVLVLAIAIKWGNFKNWQAYYPTFLFWALGNFLYLHLTLAKPLWLFTTPMLPRQLAEIMMSLLMFPCFLLLFLPYFPQKGTLKKTGYILIWVFIFSGIEYWALKINHFSYFNGWRFTYSVIFNAFMFILLVIHYKSPLWAWLISIAATFVLMTLFQIPFLNQ
ncbi:CBO0543 family protein [Desulfosporosinus nitroreducens]|uniref:Uncharacterized protein n=1 Tax=Desulfosporosinus nitroreducens TaxID=2018668 RepID=A0ABT8QVC0_9FIRM|nr:CBO0543 family protein [Desulfosporosinus nitroreducens]MDO0825115.1 hypothetical protein [Desulfosporosinus nitroreducens]